ncbi:hypothetical protein [Aestuariibaculum suncheonense]|uniref:Uncharacterized protein n=1 Tax=Aestuariibaculum suncheonense TaxID=1028745 RepID=A0A8J6QHA8_9FLAO|nr:hypothetical protein [Aestuariibaculum suncheonense]MBD0836465.1 hypothetical protein [Aestuariibaculum suncheonense]
MKLFKTSAILLALSFSFNLQAQEQNENPQDKTSYYQKRAAEDAKFEQQFSAKTKADETTFWEEQKDYEKALKRRDKKAYKAYMKGKQDAYAEHYTHCNNHCHHSDHYYQHASFYYYRYQYHYYYNAPRQRSFNTSVRLSTPGVRLGIL